MGRSFLAGLVFSLSCLSLTPLSAQETTQEIEWVPVQGSILLDDGTPICAMVLANGQYMFSCDGEGAYDLGVPLDVHGLITFFSFADGFAPFSVITDPAGFPFSVPMRTVDPDSPRISMSRTVECSGTDRVRISGDVESYGGEPLCAMILANGQHMFSCGDSLGYYDLTVAVDENGQVKVFGFADGFQPYTDIFVAPNCSMLVGDDPVVDGEEEILPEPETIICPNYFGDEYECRDEAATCVGTEDDDIIIGSNKKDVIVALDGNDKVIAGNGNDLICGNQGDDILSGGNGKDIIEGGRGGDSIEGGNGRDELRGNRGSDDIFGDNGDDFLSGGEGANDRLNGGNGYDVCVKGEVVVNCEEPGKDEDDEDDEDDD